MVDDGSSDGTCNVVKGYSRRWGSERVRLLRLGRNRGKGGALREVGVRRDYVNYVYIYYIYWWTDWVLWNAPCVMLVRGRDAMIRLAIHHHNHKKGMHSPRFPLKTKKHHHHHHPQGMLHTRGRYALMVDADGATDITCLERLFTRTQVGGGGGLWVWMCPMHRCCCLLTSVVRPPSRLHE